MSETASGDVWLQVIADMEARRKLGLERYGKPVVPGDGEDYAQHCYEELLDGAVYLKAMQQQLAALIRLVAELREVLAEAHSLISATVLGLILGNKPTPEAEREVNRVVDLIAAALTREGE